MSFLNFISLKKKSYQIVETGLAQTETGAEKTDQAVKEQIQGTARKKYYLDAVGQVCPFPLVEAKTAIAQIRVGDYLQIDFDCTQATDSIPAWAASNGHTVTEFHQIDDAVWSLTLRKGS